MTPREELEMRRRLETQDIAPREELDIRRQLNTPEAADEAGSARTAGVEIAQPPESPPSILRTTLQRFLGTDLDDPQEFERLGTTAIGAAAGAKAGVAAGLPLGGVGGVVGGVIGGVAGATAGAAAPEATLDAMKFFGLIGEREREEEGLSESELGRVVQGEAVIELLTLGTAGAVRAGGRAAGRALSGVTKVTEGIAEAAAKEGIPLAPFVVGESKLGAGIVNVLGRFPIIGSGARKVGKMTEEGLRKISEEMPRRIAPMLSSSELGIKAYRQSKNLFNAVGEGFGKAYDDLFARADELGIRVEPKNGLEAKQAVLEKLESIAPRGADGAAKSGSAASEYVREFLTAEMDELGSQTLGQMDEILAKIDQAISLAPPEIKRPVAKWLSAVKGAVKSDIIDNMKGAIPAGQASDPAAILKNKADVANISQGLAEIDASYAQTILFLFETSIGKKVGTVRRQGLKGVVRQSDEATRIPTDQLAKQLLNLNSPQAIDEFSRLVRPETFKEIAANALGAIFERSMTKVGQSFKLNADTLAKELGIGSADATRRQAVGRLLAGTGLSMDEVGKLVEAAQKVAATPIPNWSTFIARRAGIGGVKGVVRGILPFLALGSAAGGAAAAGGAGSLIGGLMFLGGSKLLVDVLSNPNSARAIKMVLKEEASSVQKRAAFLRLTRIGIRSAEIAGEMTVEAGRDIMSGAVEARNELFPKGKK